MMRRLLLASNIRSPSGDPSSSVSSSSSSSMSSSNYLALSPGCQPAAALSLVITGNVQYDRFQHAEYDTTGCNPHLISPISRSDTSQLIDFV